MKSLLVKILPISLILIACSNDDYHNYVGYWNHNDEAVIKIKKVKEDNYVLFMDEQILEKKDVLNDPDLMEKYNSPIDKRKIKDLKKLDDKRLALEFNNEIYPLTLSENNNEMYSQNGLKGDQIKFKKLPEKEAKILFKNIVKCKKLLSKKNKEIEEAISNLDLQEDVERTMKEIELKYGEQIEQIPKCEQ